MQKQDLIAVHPWRVRQSQTACHDTSAGDFDETAAGCLDRTPALRGVRFCEGGDITRLAVRQGQTVQMATILRTKRRHKRWPPTWGEAVKRMQCSHAREQRVHHQKLIADPGALVCLDVSREMRGACKKTSIILSARVKLRGDVRNIPQEPHLLARANGNRSWLDGDAHGTLELMKRQHEPP